MAYGSRSDRADYSGPRFDTDSPWHYRESGSLSYKRFAKRAASKQDRRSAFPRRSMRGYGWGVANYRYFD